jgi:SAM-dependent methyltransferase
MPANDPTNETYDQHAALIADRFWSVDLSHIWDQFCSRLSPGMQVLDLGCGPGRDCAALQARGCQVVGIDLSAGMLAEAARRAPGQYLMGDMRWLPVRPGHFDGIWANASLLHLPRAEALPVLSEMRRALRSGGVLYLSVKLGAGEEWEQREGRRFFSYFSQEEILLLVEQAGFSILEGWVEAAKKHDWFNLLAKSS